ncbi:MAG: DEAD/DEAH box helicase [Gammaproteobacteria bacterium]|nr:DEAD/DEAH box helicase [Gammaproteobacteria bacterium]
MSWRLLVSSRYGCSLEPREQKNGVRGWTKGRVVALERLATSSESFPYLTSQDRRICQTIQSETSYQYFGRYPKTEYSLHGLTSLRSAIGHPLLVWMDDPNQSVRVVEEEPIIEIEKNAEGLKVAITPFPEHEAIFLRRGDTLHIFNCNPQHLRIAKVLGESGLTLPLEAEEELKQSISTIAPLVAIHSDLGEIHSHGATEVSACATPLFRIEPFGDGLDFSLFVRPFGDNGPLFRPAEGRSEISTEMGGEWFHCCRDLQQELALAQEVLNHCPVLEDESDWQWSLDTSEEALQTLQQLEEQHEAVKIEWPEGKRLKLRDPLRPKQIQLRIHKQNEWFKLDGTIAVSEDQVLSLKEFLSLIDNTPGKFIPLGESEFLSISSQLRKQLELIRSVSQDGKIHRLATPIIDEATQEMEFKAGKAWRDQIGRLTSASNLDPELPSTLEAELRDYQLEGFRWLYRLAHWGAGACLADDMGLGKTVQALALILSRAADGPTLILAPTSVCFNWLKECSRFAPSLNAYRFGDGDRKALLATIGPRDLVVCSYGLLQSEAKLLAEVEWHTLIADEAQALKNSFTKRSQAAKQLSAHFRVITTGTPIENRLGELWNLFSLINPGLLGSQKQFNQRFALPIEQNNDNAARQRLRRLIRPFILRRLKSDVLSELPPRTEIVHQITLSDEEQIFYEALRRQAMDRLEESSDNPLEQRFKILAEITRLRRACCHPRLVLPGSQLEGSKLRAFIEILEELRSNRHRALVFSQFVDHLSILRNYLDKEKISYQYLDGSTPIKARQRAVEAFQGGEGELFLISLRAGGSGLNLTAADYVIHMDPWWNPAVEDQATDRAHRIGQQRPVTVYRLVTEQTIEEKILRLHSQKRTLAEDLLASGEQSGKMSEQDLLNLIQEEVKSANSE